jgi:hypothetical protein
MPIPAMTANELIVLFQERAIAPPPESSLMLVRHLQCKESLHLARAVTEALDRHNAIGSRLLPSPTELLPPLA